MPALLKPSSSSVHRLTPIQRLQIRNFSSIPPSSSSSTALLLHHQDSGRPKRSVLVSLTKWIVAGSSFGFLFWSLNSDSDSFFHFNKKFLSFANWSREEINSTMKDRSSLGGGSRTLLEKLSLPDYSSKFLLGDSFRRRIFFNYEKRIRLLSPPEKVFEYFASVRAASGELLMKPGDLMRAIVPVFPPSESHLVRDGYLIGERTPGELHCAPSEFFMLFDINNDGLISFKEYIFFVTLLSIPDSSFSVAFKMFDVDNNGEITREEFKKVMTLMRSQNRQGAMHRDGLRTGMKFSGSVENGGLLEYFFGEDGNSRLQHDKFVQFMRDLKDEMLKLEFSHYDYKGQGTISAKDFALSIVASAEMSHLKGLLDRVDKINKDPDISKMRITFEEFRQFDQLRRKLQPFSLALFSYGKVNGVLTKEDFQRAASRVCGISLSDNVIDITFHVFDSNGDENLSADEFLRVLHKREKDMSHPPHNGLLGFLSCFLKCGNNSDTDRFRP